MYKLIIALLPLIAQVESNNNPQAIGDNGKAIGVYQIWECYWQDGTEYLGLDWPYKDAKDPEKASIVVMGYLMRYGKHYERTTGKPVTMEVLARLHNAGPYGWKKDCSIPYWNKIKRARASD